MRQTTKRGGHQVRLSLTEVNGLAEPRADNLIEIDEALQRLTELEPRAAQVGGIALFWWATSGRSSRSPWRLHHYCKA
jgi:hypothetical protein